VLEGTGGRAHPAEWPSRGRERLDIWIVHAEGGKVGQGIEVAQAGPPRRWRWVAEWLGELWPCSLAGGGVSGLSIPAGSRLRALHLRLAGPRDVPCLSSRLAPFRRLLRMLRLLRIMQLEGVG
jgi:hypothetical protein